MRESGSGVIFLDRGALGMFLLVVNCPKIMDFCPLHFFSYS